MRRPTLKDRILKYLKGNYPQWIASGSIQRLVVEHTRYTPQTAGRVCRELESSAIIEVKYVKNHAHYRYLKKAL